MLLFSTLINSSLALAEEELYYDPVAGKFITLEQKNNQSARELLFEVSTKNLLIGEINLQEIDNQLWVPLDDVIQLFDFPIIVTENNLNEIEATGWFIKENNHFSLKRIDNEDQKHYLLETHNIKQKLLQSKHLNNQTYFLFEELLTGFNIDSEIDISSLSITINPKERLPIQDRKLREQRSPINLVSNFDAQYPREDVDYQLVSPIFADIRINGRKEADDNKVFSSSILASGDLAYMTGRYFLNHQYNERTEKSDINASLYLERNSITPTLLGSLQATHFSIGDYRNTPIANLPSSNSFGVRVSNRPYGRITNLSTVDIRGLQQPGWDVELYLNGIFIDSQVIGDNGQYNFIQQPLQIGKNLFTLRFFGVQGQREEREELYVLDPNSAVGGNLIYDASITKQNFQFSKFFEKDSLDNPDYYQTNLHIEKGLNNALSLTGDYSQYYFSDGKLHYFAQPGIRLFWGKTLFNLNHLQDLHAGSQSQLTLSRPLGYGGQHTLNYSLQTQSKDFAINVNIDPQVRLSQSLGINGRTNRPKMDYNLVANLYKRYDDSTAENYSLGIGKNFGRLGLNNNLTQSINHPVAQKSTKSLTGRLNASLNFYKVFLRGGLIYSVNPTNQINSGQFEAQWNINNRLNTKLTYSYDLNTNRRSNGLGLSWTHPNFLTSLLIDQSNKLWRAQINLQFSLGANPITGEMFIKSSKVANSGGAAVQVFEDLNNNQKHDKNEPFIQNAEVVAHQQHRRKTTDANGVALLTGLSGTMVTDIEINPNTLDDPFWVPSTDGVSFLPRPGIVKTLLIPIVTAGEVEGTVSYVPGLFKKDYNQGRVPLIMTNIKNGKILEAQSSYDGFFLFSKIPPGNYTLEVDPSFLKNKNIKTRSPVSVTISHNGSLILGINFTLHPKDMFEIIPGDALIKDKAYDIDLGVFLSEKNARTVLNVLRDIFPDILKKLPDQSGYQMIMLKKADDKYQLVLGPFFDLNHPKYVCGALAAENLYCRIQKNAVKAPKK